MAASGSCDGEVLDPVGAACARAALDGHRSVSRHALRSTQFADGPSHHLLQDVRLAWYLMRLQPGRIVYKIDPAEYGCVPPSLP